MPKIKMLKTSYGSDEMPNGATGRPQFFDEGKEYDVSEKLATAFCDQMKVAVRVGAKPATGETKPPKGGSDSAEGETKSLPGAPENKGAEPLKPGRSRKKKVTE